ncbi:hypothetical protein BBJ28_00005255 [Nothophytophthora sp. Chile5]|nr:hypothetical protein BBJ28_00005255 [Nothophytophthora sp. Chile5]
MRVVKPDDGEETESDDGARRVRLESADSTSDASSSGNSSTSDSDSDSDSNSNSDSDSSLEERSVPGDNELDGAAVSDEDAGELKVELSDSEEDEIHWEQHKMEDDADASDSEQEEALEEVGEANASDAIKQGVFQDDADPKREERPEDAIQSLLSADSFVAESEDEDFRDEAGERPTAVERQEAKWLVRSVMSHVSTVETVAIRRGLQPSGPPIQAPVSHVDEFAR